MLSLSHFMAWSALIARAQHLPRAGVIRRSENLGRGMSGVGCPGARYRPSGAMVSSGAVGSGVLVRRPSGCPARLDGEAQGGHGRARGSSVLRSFGHRQGVGYAFAPLGGRGGDFLARPVVEGDTDWREGDSHFGVEVAASFAQALGG